MKLHDFTTHSLGTNAGRDGIDLAGASGEEKPYFPHAHVPILDENLLDDECFEPDGVSDFIRDHGSWDPDRSF